MNFFVKDGAKFDLSCVSAEPKKLSIKDAELAPEGRCDVELNGENFEYFLKKGNSSKLFVFLSAAGRTKQDTNFNRIAWAGQLNANLLYIEDPMYKKYAGLDCGWYYGTKNRNFLDDIVKLTLAISRGIMVEVENIVFVGASSGGYAALYCANTIRGSKAYAYNPQINLHKWPDAKKFTNITKIDLSKEDEFGRNNIAYIADNDKSRFYIFYNSSSKHDDPQVGELLRALAIPVKNGVHKKGGLIFMIQQVAIHNPHMCVADINDFVIAVHGLYCDDLDVDAYNAYLNKFSAAALKDEEAYYSSLWYGFINEFRMDEFLHRPKVINKFHLNFGLKNYDGIFSYRVSQQRISKSCEVVFYVMKNEITFSDAFFNALDSMPELANYTIKKYESDGFIRVSKPIPNIDLCAFNLNRLVQYTKDSVPAIYEKLKH